MADNYVGEKPGYDFLYLNSSYIGKFLVSHEFFQEWNHHENQGIEGDGILFALEYSQELFSCFFNQLTINKGTYCIWMYFLSTFVPVSFTEILHTVKAPDHFSIPSSMDIYYGLYLRPPRASKVKLLKGVWIVGMAKFTCY